MSHAENLNTKSVSQPLSPLHTHTHTHYLPTPWNGKLYANKAVRNCGCGSFGTKRGGAQHITWSHSASKGRPFRWNDNGKMEQNQTNCELNISRASISGREHFIWSLSLPAVPATPTLKELTNALKSVSDWHLLGVNLDLSGSELATIERDYRGDNTRCKTEMLYRWLEKTTCPSWEAVVQALGLMEAYAAANRIQREYITPTATTEGIYGFNLCTGLSWCLPGFCNEVSTLFSHTNSP